MISKLKKSIRKNAINAVGWRTARKIVVIESDDWGAIRMTSKEVYDKCIKLGLPVDTHYFDKNDRLECEEDFVQLFDVLSSVKDKNGNHPVITANTVVANPDFEKIAASNMQEYHYELITETYKNYKGCEKSFELFKQGCENRLIYAQLHGREHINVPAWMSAINSTSRKEKFLFENKAILAVDLPSEKHSGDYFSAFGFSNKKEELALNNVMKDAITLFEDLFGYKSTTFVAPCGVQGIGIDAISAQNGVKFHQTGKQIRPMGNGVNKEINRIWGATNEVGQIYWRRNCMFEPSRNRNQDWVDSCLSDISIAFRWGKPAILNTHRVNFMGGIFPENREISNKILGDLLKKIVNRWPNVEFMSSDQLGEIIKSDRS